MKKLLLSILVLGIPSMWFTKPLTINHNSYAHKQPVIQYLTTGTSSYQTTLTANSSRTPAGWWESIEDTFYPNIPTYYQVDSVNMTFGCQFSGGYGWFYHDFTFNTDMINVMNQSLSNNNGSFTFDYWGQFHTGGTKIYYTCPLTINGSTKQDFDPNWGGWAAYRQIGGVSMSLTFNVTNKYQQDVDTVKSKMDNYVNNHPLAIDSDVSSSLVDPKNTGAEIVALDTLVKNALGEYYGQWKQYIGAYSFSDSTNNASVPMKFYNKIDGNQVSWTFYVPFKINLSQAYWNKTLGERLKITNGQVLNEAGQMVNDIPIKWDGFDVYGTTAQVSFESKHDESETLTINGTPIEVLNHKFNFAMTDSQTVTDKGDPINAYDIVVEHHGEPTGKYEINYLIKQNIPQLDLKWYAWDPNQPGNETQKTLITPTLPDGAANPKYDREINAKTGTKTQIIWVKHATDNPFPLDPLNHDGNVITDGNYDQGFIAEGSVSGMGIQQLFSDPWIKDVSRTAVDTNLNSVGTKEIIKSDSASSYWSPEGYFQYTINDQKGAKANKFITIGQNYQNKYLKFLDVLNKPDVAVDFWTTMEGLHLKNYLVAYKHLDSQTIQKLTFENVMSYWKEYVSDVLSKRIGPDPNPVVNQDLNKMWFWTLKMNLTNIDLMRQEIIKQVQSQLANTNLLYQVDYELKPFDDDTLAKLLNFDFNGNAELKINIAALATSTKVVGSHEITIINNTHYDPKTVIDLSQINFPIIEYNFKDFTVAQLRKWMLEAVVQVLTNRKIDLTYQVDYDFNKTITELIDNVTLTQFLNAKDRTQLNVMVQANDHSMKAINGSLLTMINNPNATPAPPDPIPPATDIIDLSTIHIPNLEYDFSGFTVEQLRNYILLYVRIQLSNQGASNIFYGNDYLVNGLDNNSLQDLLNNSKGTTQLKITITASDKTTKAKNSTSLLVTNNPNATPAPPDPIPPVPPIDPNNSNQSVQSLTWILSVVVGGSIVAVTTIFLVRARKKKGIGGIKKKPEKVIKK